MSLKKKSVLRDWVESIIIAFLLALVIRAFLVQAFKIPTGSMRMTLIEGDLILVNKFIYGAKIPFTSLRLPALRPPKRGDVIVFIYPEDKSKDFIPVDTKKMHEETLRFTRRVKAVTSPF